MSRIRTTAGIVSLCLLGTSAVAQTNWYVGTSGQDANGFGTSTAQPFKTITYAVNQADPGDTVQVLAGTYTNATYGVYDIWKTEQTAKINNVHGTPGQNIVVQPYQNAHVILKGDGDYIFQIRNSSYIRVRGFEIEGEVENITLDSAFAYQFAYKDNNGDIHYRVPAGSTPEEIENMTFPVLNNVTRPPYFSTMGLLAQGSHHIILENNYVHHLPGTGLRVFEGDYITVAGNEVHDCSRRSSVGNHGMVFHSSTSIDNVDAEKIFITGNSVHDNYNEVYSWSELKTFITPHIDEGKGISMQKNTFDNGWQHGWILIANNITYRNGFSGVHANEAVRMKMINNTAYLNSFTGTGNNIGISVQDGDSIQIRNNIVVADDSFGGFTLSIGNSQNITISDNLVQGDVDPDVEAIATATNIVADVLFVDAAGFDFHLTENSPAIDAALVSAAPVTDYYGTPRDATPDQGAVEFVPIDVTGLTTITAEQLIVYPNPSTGGVLIRTTEALTDVSLYTPDGKAISVTPKAAPGGYLIDLSDCAPGAYLLRLNDRTVKITKQ